MTLKLCAFADEAASSINEQVSALKRNAISLVELRSIDGINISNISEEQAKRYADYFTQEGIEVWSIGSPLGKIKIDGDFEEHLELTNHIIKLAKIFGTDRVRMFSFFLTDNDLHRETVISRLNQMNDIAIQNGIQFYNENEKDLYCDLAKYSKDVLDNVKGIKSIFDPANYIQCGQDIKEAMDMLIDRTDYFHIKDAIMGSGEVVPAGFGDGKLDEMIKRIKTDTILSIEPHLKVFSGLSEIDNHELKNKFAYKSNNDAFDAAVQAIKTLLINNGYSESNGLWIK